MIKFEYNMLVLNNAFSEEDVQQIGAYAEYVRKQERERIVQLMQENGLQHAPLKDNPKNIIALIMGE